MASEINQMRAAERCPEKAGVGGSSPSLATTLSITYSQSKIPFHSGSFQNIGLSRLASRDEIETMGLSGSLFRWLENADWMRHPPNASTSS